MDKSSWGGVLIAVGGILAGLLIEGGKLAQIIQPTAAMIVFGGTIGAVMLQFPLPVVLTSFKRLGNVFFDSQGDPQELVKEIVGFAHKARKEGIVSLDRELENVKEPFLRKSLMLAVDGTEPQELRKMMELELDNQAEHEERIPQVFEAAGGFSPRWALSGRFSASFKSCNTWITSMKWVAASPWRSSPPFTAWALPTCSSCPPPASSRSAFEPSSRCGR